MFIDLTLLKRAKQLSFAFSCAETWNVKSYTIPSVSFTVIYSSCGVLQTRSHLPVTLSLTYHFFNYSVTFSPSACAMSWHIIFFFPWVSFKLQRPFSAEPTPLGILN